MDSRQRQHLERLCPSLRWHVSMANFSSLRTGGTVEALVELRDSGVAPELLGWLHQEGIDWQVLGGGSNILFSSGLHKGVFIRLRGGLQDIAVRPPLSGCSGCSGCDEGKERLVDVGAGVSMILFLAWCQRSGLSGLENMAGIPGTVGGAVAMNAGAFGTSMGERLCAVRCLDEQGRALELAATALDFRYRRTVMPPQCNEKYMITGTSLCLCQDSTDEIRRRMHAIITRRRQEQPTGMASAGSFFKNPPGDYAGRLIEQAGLKGYSHGQAMVSGKHGNFIVNRGGASPEDILALMRFVQERIQSECGILLEPEVRIYETARQ